MPAAYDDFEPGEELYRWISAQDVDEADPDILLAVSLRLDHTDPKSEESEVSVQRQRDCNNANGARANAESLATPPDNLFVYNGVASVTVREFPIEARCADLAMDTIYEWYPKDVPSGSLPAHAAIRVRRASGDGPTAALLRKQRNEVLCRAVQESMAARMAVVIAPVPVGTAD